MTWNLHGEAVADVGLAAALARWDLDVVVLQEAGATPCASSRRTWKPCTTRMRPRRPACCSPPGCPILDSGVLDAACGRLGPPSCVLADAGHGAGAADGRRRHLNVPFPVSSLPCPYCPTLRDGRSRRGRFAAEREAAGESVIVAGDFNLTEREVAYRDLAA